MTRPAQAQAPGKPPAPAPAPAPAPVQGEDLVAIGQVASATGTSARTLRYYEEVGLLHPAGHRPGGRRLYRAADVDRVRRIRELQDLMGFNLDEIRTIMSAEDRLEVLRGRYRSGSGDRTRVVKEAIAVLEGLQAQVDAKQVRLGDFRAQLDARVDRLRPRLDDVAGAGEPPRRGRTASRARAGASEPGEHAHADAHADSRAHAGADGGRDGPIEAVVFDLDGVLLDSEQVWDDVRREVVGRHGGRWRPDATAAMQGMSSPEWAAYLHEALGVDRPPEVLVDEVVAGVLARYGQGLPTLPGALDAVRRLGARWPLGLASSANRVIIDAVLAEAQLETSFAVTLSSEEVARGKPAPDVYLEAVRRLGVEPARCAAVEDSANGIRSARAAGLRVVAVPNPHFPPPEEVLRTAGAVISDLGGLTVELVGRLAAPADPGLPARPSARR